MFYLPKTLTSWQNDNFNTVLKKEVGSLDSALLPLQQGLRQSNYAVGDNLSLTVLSVGEEVETILVKVGLFYTGVITGCNCADDPTPVEEYNEYCDVLLKINKATAATTAELVD